MLKIQQQGFFISLWKAIMNTVVAWVRKVIVAKIVHYTEEKYGEPHMHNVFHSVHVINFNRTTYPWVFYSMSKSNNTYVEVLTYFVYALVGKREPDTQSRSIKCYDLNIVSYYLDG